MKRKESSKYCCKSFKQSVREGKFDKAEGHDETEWFMPEWYHIYFCPFCGTSIKGSGYGVYDIKQHNKKNK